MVIILLKNEKFLFPSSHCSGPIVQWKVGKVSGYVWEVLNFSQLLVLSMVFYCVVWDYFVLYFVWYHIEQSSIISDPKLWLQNKQLYEGGLCLWPFSLIFIIECAHSQGRRCKRETTKAMPFPKLNSKSSRMLKDKIFTNSCFLNWFLYWILSL